MAKDVDSTINAVKSRAILHKGSGFAVYSGKGEGINYDKDTNQYDCQIERWRKE